MCRVFVNADPELYTSTTRSIRLHGVSTSLRLISVAASGGDHSERALSFDPLAALGHEPSYEQARPA